MRTFGVEEELLLVDTHSGRLMAAAQAILERLRESGRPEADGLLLEVQQEQIEVISPPCRTLTELAAAIRHGRSLADEGARLVGARAVAMATSVEPATPHLVPTARYQAMMQRFGLLLREQLTCGFHVHVSIGSDDEGVGVLDRIRIWLPVILGLSSNSPYWHGVDTGYASYRYQVWSRWPSAGPSEIFGSGAAYGLLVASMLGSGVLLDDGMVYFDARLSRRHPTVEVRIADVCLWADHAAALGALIRALVETAAREWRAGMAPVPVRAVELRLASWQASKFGVAGELVHPLLNTPCRASAAVDALLEHTRPVLAQSGEQVPVERAVERILRYGSGAQCQRRAMARSGNRLSVVAAAVESTHA